MSTGRRRLPLASRGANRGEWVHGRTLPYASSSLFVLVVVLPRLAAGRVQVHGRRFRAWVSFYAPACDGLHCCTLAQLRTCHSVSVNSLYVETAPAVRVHSPLSGESAIVVQPAQQKGIASLHYVHTSISCFMNLRALIG